MGKWTDKNYITHSEWSTLFGGAKANGESLGSASAQNRKQRLPFDCCALSLTPFKEPLLSLEDGSVFDASHIKEYLKAAAGVHPFTGNPLATTDLIPLHFHKNAKGEYHCPLTMKVFNEFSTIATISKSGQVYAYEAIERLNLLPKNMNDLISGQPFKKCDIIMLQDPSSTTLLKEDVQKGRKSYKDILSQLEQRKGSDSIRGNTLMKKVLSDLTAKSKQILHESDRLGCSSSHASLVYHHQDVECPNAVYAEGGSSRISEGRMAASLTSTAMTPVTVNQALKRPKSEKSDVDKKKKKQKKSAEAEPAQSAESLTLPLELPKPSLSFYQMESEVQKAKSKNAFGGDFSSW